MLRDARYAVVWHDTVRNTPDATCRSIQPIPMASRLSSQDQTRVGWVRYAYEREQVMFPFVTNHQSKIARPHSLLVRNVYRAYFTFRLHTLRMDVLSISSPVSFRAANKSVAVPVSARFARWNGAVFVAHPTRPGPATRRDATSYRKETSRSAASKLFAHNGRVLCSENG